MVHSIKCFLLIQTELRGFTIVFHLLYDLTKQMQIVLDRSSFHWVVLPSFDHQWFRKPWTKILNFVLSRIICLWSSKPLKTYLPPFFSNVITFLRIYPGVAPWTKQLLNTFVRIGTTIYDILKYISYDQPSIPYDLLWPTCFNALQTSLSVTLPHS